MFACKSRCILRITEGVEIMAEKIYRPVYRFLTQDHDGVLAWHLHKATINEEIKVHMTTFRFKASDGARNENWRDAVIDMEAVKRGEYGYTFEDGILKRVPADAANPKDKYKL